MLKGLNTTIDIYRRNASADDDIGGAVRTEDIVYRSVNARIDTVPPSVQAREIGIETPRLAVALIWPASYTIYEDDVILPLSGPFQSIQFRITGVRYDSVLPYKRGSKAHLELDLVRVDRGRSRP